MGESRPDLDGRLRVPVYHPGTSLDFTRVDPGAIPVVTEKVARVLAEFAPGDVQLFPVEVQSRPESYFLVNVARLVKCIDDEASAEVLYWKPEDGRPEKVGWRVAHIVADDVKEALERTGATGLDFREVTGPALPWT